MTAKRENTYIAGVHKHLPMEVYAEKTSNPYRGGTPDCYYEGDKRIAWAEYKFIEVPKRADTLIKPELSPLQLRWLRRCQANGHEALVIVGSAVGGVVLRTAGIWQHGIAAGEFMELRLDRKQIARYLYELTCRT